MNNLIKNILLASVTCFILTLAANAQTPVPTPVPVIPVSDTITISREAAIKCLEKDDIIKAKDKESAAKDQAINDLKAIISDLKVELAKTTGENTALKSAAVRTDAIIDALLRNYKARNKFGLINF